LRSRAVGRFKLLSARTAVHLMDDGEIRCLVSDSFEVGG
jgi:hypothetical protein